MVNAVPLISTPLPLPVMPLSVKVSVRASAALYEVISAAAELLKTVAVLSVAVPAAHPVRDAASDTANRKESSRFIKVSSFAGFPWERPHCKKQT